MALGEAILTCLAGAPMTGYELAKTFDTSIGFFWRAGHPQIYRELAKLKSRGDVRSETIEQNDRPNKVRYTITASGREHLRAWSRQVAEIPPVRDDMLVRLYALDQVDTRSLAAQIEDRLAHHHKRLALFERIAATRYAHAPLTRDETGKLMGLKIGLIAERGWITWCEDALATLARLHDENGDAPTTRSC